MDKDIANHQADFLFLRKQSGSCMIHSDSIEAKKKGKVLVSSEIYLQIKSKIFFNIWNMEAGDLDVSNVPEPPYKIEIGEGDIISFPAHNIHSVTVKDEDNEDKRLMAVVSYYVSSRDEKFWEGSEMIRKRRLRAASKNPEETGPKKKASPKKASETEARSKQPETRELRRKQPTNPYASKPIASGSGEETESAFVQDVATSVKGTGNRISSRGTSQNTMKNRKTDDSTWARFNKFTSNTTWQVPMNQIETKDLMDQKLWEEVANCLADTENLEGQNEMGADNFELSNTSAYKYLNQAMNNAMVVCTRREKTPSVDLFFTCLDYRSKSQVATWYRALRKNMCRTVFNRNVSQGNKMNFSARALEIETITEIMAAYSMEGSYEAAGRKNCILCTWNGVGRPYESSLLNMEFVEWCSVQKRIYGDSYQVKVSRLKTFTVGGGLAQNYPSYYV